MKNIKSRFIVIGMALTTAVAFFASTAGTLAWYAYSTRSTLSFTGTSIRKSELIHVGLVDGEWDPEQFPGDEDRPGTHKITDAEVESFGLTREAINGKSIIWTTSSTGFPQEAIKLYLNRYNYAYNFLSPVSSKTREAQGSLTLYKSPGYGETNVTGTADKGQYVCLPFAFKAIGDRPDEYLKNKKVWLVDAEVLTQTEGKRVNEAVRLHVKNPNEEFLINPSITSGTTGYTTVAGMLDLDGDGTYDYDLSNDNKEYIYGSYTGTPTYEVNPYVVPQNPEEYLPDNVNHLDLVKFPDLSTFYAKHNGGSILPVMGLEDRYITGVTYGQANYYTLAGIKPKVDTETGDLDEDTGKPLTITDDYGIGLATLTVYLEGWDHSVVNAEIGSVFNLGLTFEINKV